MNYPNVEQFETRHSEFRADLQLLREQQAAETASAGSGGLWRLVTLTFARIGAR